MKDKPKFPVSVDILVLIISLVATFIAWRIALVFPPEATPLYIFMTGIIASFLLFGMVFGLTRSERKAAEADIEHSRLIAAIETLPLGVVITDKEGQVVSHNHGLSEVLIEAGAQWTLEKLDEELKNGISIMEAYQKVMSQKRSLSWKRVMYSGKKLEVYMAPIFSEKEGYLGVLILIRDVSKI